MKTQTRKIRTGFTLVELLVVIAIIVALASMATPAIFKALRRAAMAENVSNAKQIKLILDSFAMDNDGVYPSEDTKKWYDEVTGSESSNDLFKQLFASGNTNSERIFWVKGSQVCKKAKPDDVTTQSGVYSDSETLQAGDVGFAYMADQTNTDNPSRPLIFDSPPTASGTTFDLELWDKKAVVLRIDGSAKPERLSSEGTLLDGAGEDLLSTSSEVWGSNPPNIQDMLKYPEKAN